MTPAPGNPPPGAAGPSGPLPPTTPPTPTNPPPRIFSHSWIGNDPNVGQRICRLVDQTIDEQNVIMTVGVNNGAATPVPPMLAASYNAIAVGVDTGNSSGGYTAQDPPGRCKPDLVAPGQPGNMTSFATPTVAACAALLIQHANTFPADAKPAAQRPETVKAILLASATKPTGWAPAPGKPLDEHLGAGRVNLDNALKILGNAPNTPAVSEARGPSGPQPPLTSRITKSKSWSHQTLPPRRTHTYELTTPVDLGEWSIVLTWHRRAGALPNSEPVLADLDLLLVDAQTPSPPIAVSRSRVDNVEHIYLPALKAGTYQLRVQRDPAHDTQSDPWTYTLAWRLEMR